MIKSVTVTNPKDESLTIDIFNPEESGIVIRKIDGLGPPEANIGMTELSTTDGSIYSSSRVVSRNIVLDLVFLFKPDVETVRHKVYRYFPLKKKVDIIIETDYRKLRTSGYVETDEPDIFSQMEGTQISIVCPDPYFYDLDQQKAIFSTVTPMFEFPFDNNSPHYQLIEFGSINLDTRTVLDYKGDMDTGVLINIHLLNNIKDLTIYNVGTYEKISIDIDRVAKAIGRKLQLGDDINISTVSGNKYVECVHEGITTNVISAINKDADWFTISTGKNVFNYMATDHMDDLIMTFFYHNAYGGI